MNKYGLNELFFSFPVKCVVYQFKLGRQHRQLRASIYHLFIPIHTFDYFIGMNNKAFVYEVRDQGPYENPEVHAHGSNPNLVAAGKEGPLPGPTIHL